MYYMLLLKQDIPPTHFHLGLSPPPAARPRKWIQVQPTQKTRLPLASLPLVKENGPLITSGRTRTSQIPGCLAKHCCAAIWWRAHGMAVLFRYDQKSSQPSFQTLKLSTRSKGKKGEEPLSSKIATNQAFSTSCSCHQLLES